MKICSVCGESKPLGEYPRRSGRRAGRDSRRGTCKSCVKRRGASASAADRILDPAAVPAMRRGPRQAATLAKIPSPQGAVTEAGRRNFREGTAESEPVPNAAGTKPQRGGPRKAKQALHPHPKQTPDVRRRRVPESAGHAVPDPTDVTALIPTRQGFIRMRGRTDKGRRWFQEIDLELAQTLVRERAAVVVNRHTIRRLFTNKDFRRYILTRDKHVCHFCGQYGDTIDHLLPRAKGGHTTPDNCVCACQACNQSKADRDLEEFVGTGAAGGRR